MTIDEAIKRVNEHNYIHQNKEPRAVYITEAFNTLIGVVKKYQKIEQILKEPCIIPEGCYPMLKKIERVVKDGNVDN